MSDIAIRAPVAAPAILMPPPMSPELGRMFRAELDGDSVAHEGITPAMRAEAEAVLAVLEQRLKPATLADWIGFLAPVATAVGNAPRGPELQVAIELVHSAHDEMPAVLLTPWRRREAMRRFLFWPRPAEIEDWLGPARDDLLREVEAIRAILRARDRAKPTPAVDAGIWGRLPPLPTAVKSQTAVERHDRAC
jgi:hypothetical protein